MSDSGESDYEDVWYEEEAGDFKEKLPDGLFEAFAGDICICVLPTLPEQPEKTPVDGFVILKNLSPGW